MIDTTMYYIDSVPHARQQVTIARTLNETRECEELPILLRTKSKRVVIILVLRQWNRAYSHIIVQN